jgi:N-acetylglutamate synthase-like GNAT family acetyltransferase
MNIRPATVDDVAAIQYLYRELDQYHADLVPGVFRHLGDDARPAKVIPDWIGDPEADYLVAEEDGRIVGFLNLRRAAHPRFPMFQPHDFAEIENAVVEKSRRGGGIGTQLFKAAIAWALERGLEHVQTTVSGRGQVLHCHMAMQDLTPCLRF